jgi:5'-nucleotidase
MALEENVPAARVGAHAPDISDRHPEELRIALDGDGVLFDDESETIFKNNGLDEFLKREAALATSPMNEGPLFGFVHALRQVQKASTLKLRLALVTTRNAPAHERALRTLDALGIEVDEAFFLGGLEKAPFLKEFEPDIFFDDQMVHLEPAEGVAAVAHVPFGIANKQEPTCLPLEAEDVETKIQHEQ